MTLTLTVVLVSIITFLVALILYRKSSVYTSSQNLGSKKLLRKVRKKAREKKEARTVEEAQAKKARAKKEAERKITDPCEWVKYLKKR